MRTLTIILFASLAANVFLGGFVAGRLVGDAAPSATRVEHHGWADRGDHRRLAGALSEEGREVFRQAFNAHREEIKSSHREARRLRRAYAETLVADPWDRARAEAALAALQEAEADYARTMGRMLLDAMEKLSLKDRQAMIDKMAKKRHMKRLMRERAEDGAPPRPPQYD
ncbi:periplasmic heavy metal sensor [Amphiplicatus metriothermophilus]|nr:periplasmic heavy metal sensor [Amphiplicatus metriothermophilus]MBB5519364.1 putative membrane protein [Amphiplicatus metriothermophilus]